MNKIEFKSTQKALVVGFSHPYNAVKQMAKRIEGVLIGQGYLTSGISVLEDDLTDKFSILNDSNLEVIVFLGSISLNLQINGMRLWKFIPPHVKCIEIILDSLPYDFRINGFCEYINEYKNNKNCYMASFEGNIAQTLTEYTGKQVFHLQCGAHTIPKKTTQPKFPDRLMFWGSIDNELVANDYTYDLNLTLINNNVWGVNNSKLKDIAESMKLSNDFYGFSALSEGLQIDHKDLLKPEWINALCQIDSSLKRYRRNFLIESVAEFPVDLYGKNWIKYTKNKPNMRIMDFSPDDNATFSHACQEYGAVVNIDPNWSNGTNERAITALSLGINVATNQNKILTDISGYFPYVMNRQSIVDACHKSLSVSNSSVALPQFSWTTVISKLLSQCGLPSQ